MKKNIILAFLFGSILTGFGQYIFVQEAPTKIDWKGFTVFELRDNRTNLITILGSGEIIYKNKEAQKLFQEFVKGVQESYKKQYVDFETTPYNIELPKLK